MENFDIVVVGSGIGGLVSALILAKMGQKVCVVERNNQYGGALQTFSRDKCLLDTGVHYLGGLKKGEILHKYFSFLGIMDNLNLIEMDNDGFDKITFDNDSQMYPFAQNETRFIEKLSEIFPSERENLTEFIKKIKEICLKFPLYNFHLGEHCSEILHENLKNFITKITQNPKLQAVLLGSNFLYAGDLEKTPLYVYALIMNSYISGAFKCEKGGSQITQLLLKELRKHNAKLYKHTQITQVIFTEKGEIQSVISEKGEIFTAKKFIFNTDIRQTINIIGKEKFRKSFINRIEQFTPSCGCFSLHLVLYPEKIKNFNYNIYHYPNFESVWINPKKQKKFADFYMLSSVASKKNPTYTESLSLLTYMNYDEVKKWENSFNTIYKKSIRAEEYQIFKEKHAQILIQKLEKKIPNILSSIKSIHTSTPLSYRDYLGTFNGAMYGYEKDSGNPLHTMISPKTKISNLFLTGQSISMHGILGCTIGAFNTCNEILGSELMNQHIFKKF